MKNNLNIFKILTFSAFIVSIFMLSSEIKSMHSVLPEGLTEGRKKMSQKWADIMAQEEKKRTDELKKQKEKFKKEQERLTAMRKEREKLQAERELEAQKKAAQEDTELERELERVKLIRQKTR